MVKSQAPFVRCVITVPCCCLEDRDLNGNTPKNMSTDIIFVGPDQKKLVNAFQALIFRNGSFLSMNSAHLIFWKIWEFFYYFLLLIPPDHPINFFVVVTLITFVRGWAKKMKGSRSLHFSKYEIHWQKIIFLKNL